MKHRLESQTEPTDLHWILHFNAITEQSDSLPIFFGKSCIVVSVKCWALFKSGTFLKFNNDLWYNGHCLEVTIPIVFVEVFLIRSCVKSNRWNEPDHEGWSRPRLSRASLPWSDEEHYYSPPDGMPVCPSFPDMLLRFPNGLSPNLFMHMGQIKFLAQL